MSKGLTGERVSTTDKLKEDVSERTGAAISAGKNSVSEGKERVKAEAPGYADQAKGLAKSAIETVQVMISERDEL